MRPALAIFCALLPLCPAPASAALGGAPMTPPAGATHVKASLRAAPGAGFTVRELQLSSGTTVREYVSADNRVFALKWEGPFMPNLPELLGSYIDQYAGVAARPRIGRRPVEVQNGEVVIHAGGRPRAFEGYAYLPGKFPAGVALDDLN